MTDEVTVAIVAIVVSAVVSAVGIYFAFRQARSARQSATSAQEQATAARDSVAAARDQVAAAHRQNELQEQMWRDQAQPYVVTDVRPDIGQGQMFQVVLENRGSTIARNVHVIFDPPLQQVGISREGPLGARQRCLVPAAGPRYDLAPRRCPHLLRRRQV
jgi:plasmid stabilization system protein ParE